MSKEAVSTELMSLKRRVCRKICVLFGKKLPDKLYLKMMYYVKLGKHLDLKNPTTFNEKLNWLKLNDRRGIYTQMADKYEVRQIVKERLGEEYLIPLLGLWDFPEEINFDDLPNQFVLKCTHDSGSVVICKDKMTFNREEAVQKLQAAMRINYFYPSREWPYKDIKPRIIAEAYMVDESGTELKDYKIYNFSGKPELIQVDFGRFVHHERNLYSLNWEYIDETIEYPKNPRVVIPKPDGLEEMCQCARKLAEGIPSVRTDFYSINGKIYFGEITFYQEAGFAKFEHEEFAERLGDLICIDPMN
ncbi:MAG: glycosyl transferase [Lachnospiraceae bacterium]|nr:glycosyl transferase [Lachnospiraceae bacterium]